MKKWYDKKIRESDKKHIREFLKQFNIRLHHKKISCGGEADYCNGIVIINSRGMSMHKYLSMAMHELWHCLCYRQGLYSNYHYDKYPKTKKQIIKFRRIAFKAEKFVDKKAEQMMRDYFPDIPYEHGYKDSKDKEWYYKHYLDKYYPLT